MHSDRSFITEWQERSISGKRVKSNRAQSHHGHSKNLGQICPARVYISPHENLHRNDTEPGPDLCTTGLQVSHDGPSSSRECHSTFCAAAINGETAAALVRSTQSDSRHPFRRIMEANTQQARALVGLPPSHFLQLPL